MIIIIIIINENTLKIILIQNYEKSLNYYLHIFPTTFQ